MKKILIIVAGLIISLGLKAKIRLPDILSNYAVLQQNTNVRLWGEASINTSITISPSWSKISFTTKSDNNGKWSILIPTPKASFDPQSIIINDGDTATLSNILIGEVWFCSGQSNMEHPLRGWAKWPVKDGQREILHSAEYRNSIRFLKVQHKGAKTRQEYAYGKWEESIPENAKDFSAVAYSYAKHLTRILKVPIGIINCSWGGTYLEAWMPKKLLINYQDINLSEKALNSKRINKCPLLIFNAMVNPLEKYTIKGFLFYQGESNQDRNFNYDKRLADMVKIWREEWNLGELPFYFVQIAPFMYQDKDGITAAILREDQFNALKLIPNSGIVCTYDLVQQDDLHNVHIPNKEPIGFRLALLSLSRTYGINGFADSAPYYKDYKIEKNKIIISFENSKGFNRNMDIKGFEIAGEDKYFYPAIVQIKNKKQIQVFSYQVANPVAVRYCFKNFQLGNFKSLYNLPIPPFRTDNWDK